MRKNHEVENVVVVILRVFVLVAIMENPEKKHVVNDASLSTQLFKIKSNLCKYIVAPL